MVVLVVLIVLLILLTFLGAFGGSIRYKETYYVDTEQEYPIIHPTQMNSVPAIDLGAQPQIPDMIGHPSGTKTMHQTESFEEEQTESYIDDQGTVEPYASDVYGAPY